MNHHTKNKQKMNPKEKELVEARDKALSTLRDLAEYYDNGMWKIAYCMKECSPEVRKPLKKMLCKAYGMLDDIKEAVQQLFGLPSTDETVP